MSEKNLFWEKNY